MDISVAYFQPLFRSDAVRQDFEQLRAAGAGSILYTIQEQERQRWPRDLERGLRQAHEAGLKVYLGLGRHGNLFAGPLPVPSWYTFEHLESRVMDRHGRYHNITCFNHEPFQRWLFQEIESYLSMYPIDGVLIEEPHYDDVTCFCSVCRALCPDVADLPGFRRRSLIAFLGDFCACVKRVNASVKTMITVLPRDLSLLEDLALLPRLDILGCHLFWSALSEDIAQVEAWGRRTVEIAHLHEKRSQLWLQNFDLDEQGEQQLESAFEQILASEPDEIGCYYYWRNNADPERVWQKTRRLLRRVPRRQLFWQTYKLPAVPVRARREETQEA